MIHETNAPRSITEPLIAQSRAEGANLTDVFAAVVAERARQDSKWGGAQADDARKTPMDWCLDIEAYNTWACQMYRMGSPEKYRHRMMQIAALAIAACESYDRQAANAIIQGPRSGPAGMEG